MSVLRDAVRMVLITLALAGIGVALAAAWLVDRVYDSVTA
jgi:hypothetical protein